MERLHAIVGIGSTVTPQGDYETQVACRCGQVISDAVLQRPMTISDAAQQHVRDGVRTEG